MGASLCAALLLLGCGRPTVCFDGQDLEDSPANPSPQGGYLVFAHAHNDYEQNRPLLDALEQGFRSVEADVWQYGGDLHVSHMGFSSKGTLEQLYLRPLQQRVEESGSVHGDGEPFLLWLDIKRDDDDLQGVLASILSRYPLLLEPSAGSEAAVRIVLSGKYSHSEGSEGDPDPCSTSRDSLSYALDDSAADERWGYYSLDWGHYIDWDGSGEMPADERARLNCIVHNAHEKGRAVRFYDNPDTEDYWRTALETGVDLINTDRVADLSDFLQSYSP